MPHLLRSIFVSCTYFVVLLFTTFIYLDDTTKRLCMGFRRDEARAGLFLCIDGMAWREIMLLALHCIFEDLKDFASGIFGGSLIDWIDGGTVLMCGIRVVDTIESDWVTFIMKFIITLGR